MADDIILEAPGFRGRIVGTLGAMQVIDATVDGDIPPHTAEADEFAVILSGRFEVILDGIVHLCGPGDYRIVPKGQNHAIKVLEAGRLILIGSIPD